MRSRIIAASVLFSAFVVVRADDPKPSTPTEKPAPKIKLAPLIRLTPSATATTKPVEPKTPALPTGTHETVKTIDVKGDKGGRLQTLSISPSGDVFALVGPARTMVNSAAANPMTAEVQVFDSAGQPKNKWTVNFLGQCINCGPDGSVYVAGDGKIASFDETGKVIREAELPHLASVLGDSEKLKAKAEEQRQQEIESYQEMVKEQTKVLEELTKKDPEYAEVMKKLDGCQKKLTELRVKLRQAQTAKEDTSDIQKQVTATLNEQKELQKTEATKLSNVEKQQLKQADMLAKSYQMQLDRQKSMNVDAMVKQIASRLRITNAVAITEKDIYVVSGELKGYGYAIWRMNRDLTNPKQVMSGVRGCCGQMDIQAVGEELWVAQNCDHKVGRYDRDGKLIKTMGKRGRDGEADCFGGCCNPMNIRLSAKGLVYTAESEGIVRLFSTDGESKGVVGSVKITGGCKNVALAVSPDGNKVYFCDQPGSKIHVMVRKQEAASGSGE